jgi:hypothetical protein
MGRGLMEQDEVQFLGLRLIDEVRLLQTVRKKEIEISDFLWPRERAIAEPPPR